MKFLDENYIKVLKSSEAYKCSSGTFAPIEEALFAANERALTLEAEIKVLVDGAGKDRAEIERLENENQTLRGGFSASDEFGHGMVLTCKKLEAELKLSEARRAELVEVVKFYAGAEHSNIELDIFDRITLRGKSVTAFDSDWLCGPARKALASQSRPKILDVLEAAGGFMEHGSAKDGTHGTILKNALAAMEKE